MAYVDEAVRVTALRARISALEGLATDMLGIIRLDENLLASFGTASRDAGPAHYAAADEFERRMRELGMEPGRREMS